MSGACEGKLGDGLKLAWRFRTGGGAGGTVSAVKSSAVIDGGRVFIGADDGRVYALTLERGELIWSVNVGSAVSAPPLVLGSSVIVGTEGNGGVVYCLDVADGGERWSMPAGGKVVAAANHFVDAAGRDCVLVGTHGNMLHGFDAADGKPLWSINMGSYVNAPCSVAGSMAVLAVCDGSVRVLDLTKATDKVELDVSMPGLVATAMAVRAGKGYAADCRGPESLYCLDLSSGDVDWRRPLGAGTMAPAAVTDEYVLVVTAAAESALHCFTLAGEFVWRYAMSGGSNGGPLVVGDRVLLGGDDGYLRLLRLADGERLWQYRVGGPIESSPAIAAGFVIVGCNDGYVYAFRVE